MVAPHGIPVDLLDRLVIVRTLPYSVEEMVQILQLRARVEGITVDGESLAALGAVAEQTSLRHAVQLLTPASILAKTCGREALQQSDVADAGALRLSRANHPRRLSVLTPVLPAASLFLDAKASAKILAAQADRYVTV